LGSSVDAMVGHELAYLSGTSLTRHLEPTLALVQEALVQPALHEDELRPLCDEAAEILLSERDDDDTLADLFLRQALYPDHPLYHAATGTLPSLRSMPKSAIERAYGQLRPERLIVAMAGDIDADRAAELVTPLLEALRGPVPEAPVLPPLPKISRPTIVIVDKPERTQVQLRVARAGLGTQDPDIDPFWLGVNAFGGTFTSPLTKQVRDVRGWSYFAHADFRRRSLFPSPVVLRSAPALGDALDCLALKLDMFADLSQGRMDEDSLMMAKNYLLGRVPFAQATAFDVVGPAVFLDILGLPSRQLWDLPERLDALDLRQVPAVMAKALGETQPLTVMVAPKDAVYDAVCRRFPTAHVQVVPFDEGLEDADQGA
jgi:predicted Zn-dependent peptidase